MRPGRHFQRLVVLCGAVLAAGCGGAGPGAGAGSGPQSGGMLPVPPRLVALAVSAGHLAPEFSPTTLAYDVGVGGLVSAVTVTPTATDPSQTITLNGASLTSGETSLLLPFFAGGVVATLTVTATDATRLTYTVSFHRIFSPAQEAYLKASNTGVNDEMGGSVAVSGDSLVVGAEEEDSRATGVNGNQNDESAPKSGAAYVYAREGRDWTQQAYLKASNTDARDEFGREVAISGDTIVVGAPNESSSATGVDGDSADNSSVFSGAAYVFVREGTTWRQQAYLKASNTGSTGGPGASDRFGSSVAIHGDTVVVGAPFESSSATGVDGDQLDNSAPDSGAAYVFVRTGTTWRQEAYLKASNTGAGDRFGIQVAISGDTIAVGADLEDSAARRVNGLGPDDAPSSGAAYVFVRRGPSWAQQAYVKASNTGAGDLFGRGLALSGDLLVVGAALEASNGLPDDDSVPESGAAYVYERIGTSWEFAKYLKATHPGAGDQFGRSVTASEDTVAVAARNEASAATGLNGNQLDRSAQDAGAVYVFRDVLDGGSLAPVYVKASNTDAFDQFGADLALAGDTLVVGAFREASAATGVNGNQADDSASEAGAVYVIR